MHERDVMLILKMTSTVVPLMKKPNMLYKLFTVATSTSQSHYTLLQLKANTKIPSKMSPIEMLPSKISTREASNNADHNNRCYKR